MLLNHPKTNPHPRNPWSMEKLSSMKLVPGAKKVGGRCIKASEVGRRRVEQTNTTALSIPPWVSEELWASLLES